MLHKELPFTLKKYLNTLLVVIPFAVSWFVYYEPMTLTTESKQVSILVIATHFILFYWLCHLMDGFRPSTAQLDEMVFNQIISAAMANLVSLIEIWMLSIHFPYLLPGILSFLVQCCIIPIICKYNFYAYYYLHKPRKTVIIEGVRKGAEELINENEIQGRFKIEAVMDIGDVLRDLDAVLKDKEVIFLFGVHSHERNIILKQCTYRNIQLFILPRVGDLLMSGTEEMHMLHLPILRSKGYNPTMEYRAVKRIIDIIFSALGLVVLSPLLLVTLIAVKSDGGPAFYKQIRLTQNGREFEIIKFRCMCVDAEKLSGAVLSAGENDPRITKVGKIIRAFRIDEMPQLFNILRGDMTIVGPRPERPEIAAEYEKELPEFSLRLQAKAGLTGYAQVYGKYNSSPYDKLLMDLIYIAHPSLVQDLKIVLKTIKTLFDKESTEGVAQQGMSLAESMKGFEEYPPEKEKGDAKPWKKS
ncbi:MAG: sugar transferase [Clostridia bacterium]|nr:sugar transferase [Clostridia bacterium]